MEEREVIRFIIEYKGGTIGYFTEFENGSIEICQDGWVITSFERNIKYSDEFDYGYGYDYDLPKIERYEYKISPWELQRVFFNRYDLLSLKPCKENEGNKDNEKWSITIVTDKDTIKFSGTKYPEPYGEEFFNGLKRLIKYKVVPDLP